MTWEESKRPIVTKKGVENKAPRHHNASKKSSHANILVEPLLQTIFYAGRENGKPQGKFIYVSEDKNYAKNFGDDIYKFYIHPKKIFDLTVFKENFISFDKLNKLLKDNEIVIKKIDIYSIFGDNLNDDEIYKPAWQWIRKYPEIADKIKNKGYDSIKQMETFSGKGKPTITLQILDNSIIISSERIQL